MKPLEKDGRLFYGDNCDFYSIDKKLKKQIKSAKMITKTYLKITLKVMIKKKQNVGKYET